MLRNSLFAAGALLAGLSLALAPAGATDSTPPTTAMPQTLGEVSEVPVEAPVARFGAIEIVGPWSRGTLAGTRVGGAYFLLRNTGDEEVRLLAAKAPVAAAATLRNMPMVDGVVKSVPLEDGVAIPPGGEVDFRPGSYHVMLQNLSAPLRPGTTFPLTLTFSDGTEAVVDVIVWDVGTMRIIAK